MTGRTGHDDLLFAAFFYPVATIILLRAQDNAPAETLACRGLALLPILQAEFLILQTGDRRMPNFAFVTGACSIGSPHSETGQVIRQRLPPIIPLTADGAEAARFLFSFCNPVDPRQRL